MVSGVCSQSKKEIHIGRGPDVDTVYWHRLVNWNAVNQTRLPHLNFTYFQPGFFCFVCSKYTLEIKNDLNCSSVLHLYVFFKCVFSCDRPVPSLLCCSYLYNIYGSFSQSEKNWKYFHYEPNKNQWTGDIEVQKQI